MVTEVHLESIEMPFNFITAIPLNVWKGSGCFVGIKTLAKGIRALGGEVNFVTPGFHLPVYAAERMLFNHMLRYREFSSHDTIVGFDADGYSIAGRHSSRHVATIKGVIADVLPYERERREPAWPSKRTRKAACPKSGSRHHAKPILRYAAR